RGSPIQSSIHARCLAHGAKTVPTRNKMCCPFSLESMNQASRPSTPYGILALRVFVGHWRFAAVFAYFDESGKFRDSDFICIAGFVSDDARWNVFAEQWDRLLKAYKIPALHMRHVMPLKGPFEGWDREQAKKMLGEFIDIIRRNVFIGLGVGMDTKYLRSMPSDVRKQIGDPQYFCFQRILRLLVKKVEELGYKSS